VVRPTSYHVDYVWVEGFSNGRHVRRAGEVEVEKVVGYLLPAAAQRLRRLLRFARLSAQDLELSVDNDGPVRGAVIAGATATPAVP
jgi:hypothetical protein